jgi:50S ribosomal subunit-associated GTPase HflX
MLVVFTKQDITEVREQTAQLRPLFEERGYPTLAISAVTREGLPELVNRIAGVLDQMRQGDQLDRHIKCARFYWHMSSGWL